MPLITLFSAPKPFTNSHIAMIQRNAIKSWTLLSDVEVILLGEEAGLAEAARELGVKHLTNVRRNESGTPLISSMFQLAREHSNSDLLCIINADMILMPDFVEAASLLKNRQQAVGLQKFVSVCPGVGVSAKRSCQKTESTSSSGRKRFFPFSKILLHRHSRFCHRSCRLG